ncbi:MAG: acyl-CoA dehydrogenase family protein [Myxococcota bacterium]
MDLSYGPEYAQFRAEVCAFLESNWPPRGEEAELERNEQQRRFRTRATAAGYLYRGIPRQYGGSEQEPDALKAQIIREEFRRVRAPQELGGIGLSQLVPTLLECGADWQKEKFIRKTIEGEYAWCQGFSEPGSGSDLASVKTRGELVGDEWVINGQKIWTSFAKQANYMFALVRTEPDAPKHAGISYLLLEVNQPGIEIRPLKQITGTSEFNEVFFTDARTPTDWIVGKRGQGWQVSRSHLRHERNSLGSANASGGQFGSLLRLARNTERNGHPAIEDPALREQLAEVYGYVQAQAYSGYLQLTRDAKGEDPGIVGLMNKLGNSNIGHKIARIALSLLGSDSLLAPLGRAPGNERWMNQFMGSLGMSIAGGTSNIQRNIIAERGLGLPRDRAASEGSGQ